MGKPHYFALAAMTIDGYIARYPGHDSNWTSEEDTRHLHEMEDKADVLLLARTSYEIAKKRLAKRKCIVLTSKVNGLEEKGNALYVNPEKTDLGKIVREKGYKKVCVLGGRGAYNYALKKGLLDEIYLTVEPIVFGEGIGMFSEKTETKRFSLVSVKKLNNKGSLLLRYKKKS